MPVFLCLVDFTNIIKDGSFDLYDVVDWCNFIESDNLYDWVWQQEQVAYILYIEYIDYGDFKWIGYFLL